MRKGKLLLVVVLVLISGLVQQSAAQSFDRTLHVNVKHSNASDRNPGTSNQPLRTFDEGVKRAIQNKDNNLSTRVLVYPGTYRESVDFRSPTTNNKAIIIEAESKGVIISGSDVWSGWSSAGGGRYKHNWPYNWGAVENPWRGKRDFGELGRRREMIFVNGELLRQVLSLGAVTEGTFFVDEAANLVHIHPPAGTNMGTATVEVGVRDQLFAAGNMRNLTVRGLTFQHAVSAVSEVAGEAVKIANSRDILLEDLQIRRNSWLGLHTNDVENMTIRRVTANHNGASGMGGLRLYDLLVEDSETSFNNWRGDMGGFHGWSTGQKFFALRNATFRRYVSANNMSNGLWFDEDNSNVSLENVVLARNHTANLFLEKNQGPFTIENSTICGAGLRGIQVSNTKDVTITNSKIYNNNQYQILITGARHGDVTRDHQTGKQISLKARDWKTTGNTISGGDKIYHKHVSSDAWDLFRHTLTTSRNAYHHSTAQDVFFVDDFAGWKARTDGDPGSTFSRSEPSLPRCPTGSGDVPPPSSNKAPSVQFVMPEEDTAFEEPAAVYMKATATDTDGRVSKVEFYRGSTLLATDESDPYDYRWTDVPAGTYTITAKATDNDGATARAEMSITVTSSGGTSGAVIGEAGTITTDQKDDSQWHRIDLTRTYREPVVLMALLSYNGSEPANVRVRNVKSNSFEFQIDEWDYLDSYHVSEQIGYLVVEAGTHKLEDGTLLEAGHTTAGTRQQAVSFASRFASSPVVLSQVVTTNDGSAVVTRQQGITKDRFAVYLQGEEAKPNHGNETVAWLAIEEGKGRTGGKLYEAGFTGDVVTDDWHSISFGQRYDAVPVVLAAMQRVDGSNTAGLRYQNLSVGSVEVKVEEGESHDSETTHTTEPVGYVAFVAGRISTGSQANVSQSSAQEMQAAEPDAAQLQSDIPVEYELAANYPNPFNPSTEIAFALPEAQYVRLVIYDALGREVARLVDGPMGAGNHTVRFEARHLPSGVYLYRLNAGHFTQTRRMLLVK